MIITTLTELIKDMNKRKEKRKTLTFSRPKNTDHMSTRTKKVLEYFTEKQLQKMTRRQLQTIRNASRKTVGELKKYFEKSDIKHNL